MIVKNNQNTSNNKKQFQKYQNNKPLYFENQFQIKSTPSFGNVLQKGLNLDSLNADTNNNMNKSYQAKLPTYSYLEEQKDANYGRMQYYPQERKSYSLPKQLNSIDEVDEIEIPFSKQQQYQYQQQQQQKDMGYKSFAQKSQQGPPTVHRRTSSKDSMLKKLSERFEALPDANQKQDQRIQNRLDSKSVASYAPSRMQSYSVAQLTSHQDRYQPHLGRSEEDNLNKQYNDTKLEIARVFNKYDIKELESHSKKWFMNKMLPWFIQTLGKTLTDLNGILKEYFDRRITEMELFNQFATNMQDQWSQSFQGRKQVNIDQVLTFYETLEKQGSWLWVPDNQEKFEREHREIFLSCLHNLVLFDKILNIKCGKKTYGRESRGKILDRLLTINYSQKYEYNVEFSLNMPTDIEVNLLYDFFRKIFANLFMNIINKSVQFEEEQLRYKNIDGVLLRHEEVKIQRNSFRELFAPIQVLLVNADQVNIEPPGFYDPDSFEKNLSPAYFLQQVFTIPHEPVYHFYSDMIYQRMAKKDFKKLTPSISDKSIFQSIGFYFLHLLCLQKDSLQKVVQYDYQTSLIRVILEGATEIQYNV